jgi:uncharacterized protein YwgA
MKGIDKCVLFVLKNLQAEVEKEGRFFGKTITQKAFYFLKEALGVNLPFTYVFYHYGPYSSDLQNTIEKLELYGLLRITTAPTGLGYSFQVSERGLKEIQDFEPPANFLENTKRIQALIHKREPKELELLSTIHFAQKTHNPENDGDLVSIVKYLKPRFETQEINEKIEFLRDERILTEN